MYQVRKKLQVGLIALVCIAGLAVEARAAATVRKLNLVISIVPTSINGGGFNDLIDNINRTALEPRGLEGMDRVTSGWYYEGQLRYFVRPNVAVNAGVGQMRSSTSREYLPAIDSSIQLFGEVLTVPVNVGAAYYLTPYNQGDFQARAYFGGGFLSLTHTRARFQQTIVNVEGVPPEAQFISLTGTQDSPGYYAEIGGHMFFASRYSVMISGIYRSAVVDNLQDPETGEAFLDPTGQPMELNLSGLGIRFAVALGF